LTSEQFVAGDSFSLHHADVSTIKLHHPGGATGYALTMGHAKICYITDVEHHIGTLDEGLLSFMADADIVFYDSTYDDATFHHYQGWGHSTWQQAIRLGQAANVKQMVLFHHDIHATDAVLDKRQKMIAQMDLPLKVIVAQEQMVFEL
jgi:phosphoribosyl 1,2-cyclic phosphodiesterase